MYIAVKAATVAAGVDVNRKGVFMWCQHEIMAVNPIIITLPVYAY